MSSEIPARVDVVIVGAGHNGLVSAVLLAVPAWTSSCWRPPT